MIANYIHVGEGLNLPYRRIPIKCRRNEENRKSLCNITVIISAGKFH